MKSWTLSLLIGLLALAAQAQNYRPFRPGLLYQLGPAVGDTTTGVLLDKRGFVTAGDSVYPFNSRVRTSASLCLGYPYANDGSTPVGSSMRIRMTATGPEYQLTGRTTSTAYTLALRPLAPLNQPWAALGTLTAQVTARGVAQVFGQPDSVVTITLADGQTLQLSKQWGFLNGPMLADYYTSRARRRLVMSGLPTKQLGSVRLSALAVFDFQPGDVLWYRSVSFNGTGSWPPPSTTYGDSVLSRTVSRGGDSIVYRIARGTTNRQVAWTVRTEVITEARWPQLQQATGGYQLSYANAPDGIWMGDLAPQANMYLNRPMLVFNYRYRNCNNGITSTFGIQRAPIDYEKNKSFALGLGLVSDAESNMTCCYYSTSLIGYRKRRLPTPTNPTPLPEEWGTLPRFASVLKATDYRPAASTTVFPNPFTRELTVQFETSKAQQAEVQLFNALGQLVYQATQPVPAGTAALRLQLPMLPAGLYTAHLHHDARTEVLKVTAAP